MEFRCTWSPRQHDKDPHTGVYAGRDPTGDKRREPAAVKIRSTGALDSDDGCRQYGRRPGQAREIHGGGDRRHPIARHAPTQDKTGTDEEPGGAKASGEIAIEYRPYSFLLQQSTNEYSQRAWNAAACVNDKGGAKAFIAGLGVPVAIVTELKQAGVIVMCMAGDPPPSTRFTFDPETRCHVKDGVAGRHFATPESLLSELTAAGFAIASHWINPATHDEECDEMVVAARRA